MIDLRSDTVTKPTAEMLEAMMSAEVGDDIFGEDPTVNALEEKCASLFGMDGALYCPSGTMANQIGMAVLSRPYEEIICYEGAHIYKYEGGGLVGNSGLSVRLISGDRGKLTVKDILANINPDDQHYPKTSVVEIENTVNKAGGSYYTIEELTLINTCCQSNELKMHLDGARLFNAMTETGDTPLEYGKIFDTISVCLSKGLGAPIGSVLMYKKEYEHSARRRRKVFGGGMRQAGFIAAAGIYALDHNVKRLSVDHERAKILGTTLESCPWVEEVLPVDTNIVIFRLAKNLPSSEVVAHLESKGLRSIAFGPHEIRLVTHLDFTEEQLEEAVGILRGINL